MHRLSDPSILYFGTPVIVISTLNEDGSVNIAPMSSVWWLGHSAMLGLDGTSKTTQNLQRTGECVLNLASSDNVDQVNKLALSTGCDEVPRHKQLLGYRSEKNKMELAGLTTMPSVSVAVPRIKEFPVQLEGKVENVRPFGKRFEPLNMFATSVEVDVVKIHVEEHLLVEDEVNRINSDEWKPLIMNFRKFYSLGNELQHSTLSEKPEILYTPWKQSKV